MRFRPKRISIRPLDSQGRVVPDSVWRTLGVLSASVDMDLVETMPDDTETVLALSRSFRFEVMFRDLRRTALEIVFGVPAGFPLWFVTPRLALPEVRFE